MRLAAIAHFDSFWLSVMLHTWSELFVQADGHNPHWKVIVLKITLVVKI